MRRKTIILSSLILLLLIVASILFFQSNYPYKKIEQKVLPLVEEAIGRKIVFSHSHIHLFPFYWTLDNASLRDVKTGDTLLNAKTVRINLRLNRLAQKSVLIKDIQIEGPVLAVIRYPDGRSNLEGLFPQKKPTGWHVTIDRIDINNGSILYEDQLSQKNISLKKANARINPDLPKKEVRWDFTAEGTYKDRNISEEGLNIKGNVAIDIRERTVKTVKVKGFSITSPQGSRLQADGIIGGDGTIDLKGNTVLSLAEIGKHLHGNKNIDGKITLTGEVKGSLSQPAAEGNLIVDDLKYDGIRYGDLKFGISFKENLLNLSNIDGKILNGRIEGNINLAFREDIPSYHVLLKIADVNPHSVISRYIPALQEHIDKEGMFGGEIEASGSSFDKEMLEGKGSISYNDSNQRISLSGEIKRGLTVSAGVSGELTDIADYLHIPHFPFHGLASLTGELSGTIGKPVVSGVVVMPKGTVKEIVFDSVTADLSLSEGTIHLRSVTLRRSDAFYTMSGNIQFRSPGFKDPYFDLEGDLSRGSPRDIVSIFYRTLPVDMKADGHVKFTGDSKDLQLVAELNGSAASVYGQTFESGQVALTLTRERIIFDRITMKQEKDIVTGKGWIGFGGEFKGEFLAEATSERFNIENITLLKDGFSFFKGNTVFKLSGSGKFSDPLIDASVEIPHLFIKEVDTGLARLIVSKDGEEMKVRGEALDMNYTGHLTWNAERPFIINIQMKESRLNPILAMLKPSLSGEVTIHASGETVIEGRLTDLSTIQSKTVLSRMSGFYGDYRIENEGDIRLSFSENKLTFDLVRFKGEGTSIGVIGGLIPHGDTNIFVNGEADLRLLTLLTPEIKYSKGKAFVAFLISGEMENPSIQGGLAVKDGTIRSATLKQTLEGASLSVFFNGREIVLESMQAVLGGGTVNGSGKIEIREFEIKEFGLILEIADALFRYPEGLDSRVDGTFIFQGTPKSKALKGEVRIKKASYEKNINIRSMILELQRKKVKVEQPVPFFGNTDLNIHISGKKDIWINNNLAKLPVDVDLIMKGTIDHPLLFGRIEALDGTFVFSRNPFKVVSATADFISPDTIRPVLDIHATTEVRGYKIDLRLSGTVDRFNLSLNSEPTLSDTDILALLTVGQTAPEVAETMKEVGAAEATALLAAPIQEKIENTLQNVIKIDRFQVDPYYSNSTASGGARLTVGKRLLEDRLYVTYTTGITTVEELIKLEYFVGRNVYIVGERDEQGRMSGDIKFRFEFR